MNIKQLSRQEKESLYIKKMTELQLRWKNPIDSNWDFINNWIDEELEKNIEETIGQLGFEKGLSIIKKVTLISLIIFVVLGIFGLLFFGIK